MEFEGDEFLFVRRGLRKYMRGKIGMIRRRWLGIESREKAEDVIYARTTLRRAFNRFPPGRRGRMRQRINWGWLPGKLSRKRLQKPRAQGETDP